MDYNTLLAWMTEGLTPEQAAPVKAAIERDTVKQRVLGLKQQQEYDEIATREQTLRTSYDQAKTYQDWYSKNYSLIKQQEEALKAYQTKFGDITTAPPQQQQSGVGLTKEQIEAMIEEKATAKVQSMVPNIASTVKGVGTLVQRHMYSKREKPLDFEAIDKLMSEKGYNLEQAYDEYDKPEREKAEQASREADVERRVKERVQQMRASENFPAGSDFTTAPGGVSMRGKEAKEHFDKRANLQDLAKTWVGADSN